MLARLGKGLFGIAGGLTLATTLMACYGAPPMHNGAGAVAPTTGCTDADHDLSCVPNDCNDSDATVRPGAEDAVGDGADQNCDGIDG